MKLVIDGMSIEQARMLARWYERFGEQCADDWLSEHGLRAPLVDVHDKNCITETNDAVIVKVK